MEKLIERVSQKLEVRDTTVLKDLKINFGRLATESQLAQEEFLLLTIATAKAAGSGWLLEAAREFAAGSGISSNIIDEAEDNAAIMGMLNIYYRYRHFVEHNDAGAKEAYGNAKLRMMSLGSPAMGKEKFEMLALAVSAINGCENCVSSHERALIQLGVSRDKLHDVARLAAVVKGISIA